MSPVSKQLSDSTYLYVSNALSGSGVSVSVQPTPLNEFTAELTAREKELDAREAAIAGRDISARTFAAPEETDFSVYILSTILFVLTVLILLNYVMDWVRVRKMQYEQQGT